MKKQSSYHVLTKKQFVLQEELVVVSSAVTTRSDAGEAIQVQLALKRCELGLAEERSHYLLDEIFGFVDKKAPPMRLPIGWFSKKKCISYEI